MLITFSECLLHFLNIKVFYGNHDVFVVVVAASSPTISCSSHPLVTQRSQSRSPLLDYLCCF